MPKEIKILTITMNICISSEEEDITIIEQINEELKHIQKIIDIGIVESFSEPYSDPLSLIPSANLMMV